jgi:hypothetical protein
MGFLFVCPFFRVVGNFFFVGVAKRGKIYTGCSKVIYWKQRISFAPTVAMSNMGDRDVLDICFRES